MNRRRTLMIVGTIAAAVVAVAVVALIQRPATVHRAPLAADVAIEVYGLGTVEARVRSDLGFQVEGLLTRLLADHGDRVAAGTTLARLESARQEARVAAAEATVGRRRGELARAREQVDQAQAELALSRRVNERRQALVDRAVVSVESAQEAATEVAVAAAELAVAEAEVAVADAAVADAEATLRLEAAILDDHTMEAPYDALVIDRLREIGTVLSPGEPVFTVVDPDSIWVLAYVDESRAGGLRVGQPATIRLRSRPGQTFAGRVARIDIRSDPLSEERRVRVRFGDLPDPIHLQEQAEVVIQTDRLDRAVLVPERLVQRLGDGTGRIWAVADGRLVRRRVALGPATLDGRVAVPDPPDDVVAVAGPAEALQAGARVRLGDDAADGGAGS